MKTLRWRHCARSSWLALACFLACLGAFAEEKESPSQLDQVPTAQAPGAQVPTAQVPKAQVPTAEDPAAQDRTARVPTAQVPEGTKILRNLEYIPGGHARHKLDLYLPPRTTATTGGEKLPLVIWVHGGAWLAGSKEDCPALFLLREGFAVASVNYRLSQHALFPAQIEDVKAAVRWLRASAPAYGLDPDRFGAWGASAGGHLVALLGTSGDVKELDGAARSESIKASEGAKAPDAGGIPDRRLVSSRVQAVCDFFGPTDLTQMSRFPSRMDHDAPDSPESRLIGGPVQENKEKAARANPIAYATKDDPPFLILHGDQDPLVPLNQSELLDAALRGAGVEVTLHVVKGAGHGFGGPEITLRVREFFAKHLKRSTAGATPPGNRAAPVSSRSRLPYCGHPALHL